MTEIIVLKHLRDASLVCDMVEQLEAQEGLSISLVHFHKQLPESKIVQLYIRKNSYKQQKYQLNISTR